MCLRHCSIECKYKHVSYLPYLYKWVGGQKFTFDRSANAVHSGPVHLVSKAFFLPSFKSTHTPIDWSMRTLFTQLKVDSLFRHTSHKLSGKVLRSDITSLLTIIACLFACAYTYANRCVARSQASHSSQRRTLRVRHDRNLRFRSSSRAIAKWSRTINEHSSRNVHKIKRAVLVVRWVLSHQQYSKF